MVNSGPDARKNDIGLASPDYEDSPQRGRAIYDEAFTTVFEYIYTSQIVGDVAEFGTYKGFTAGVIARLIRDFEARDRFAWQAGRRLLCYDSFEAFPSSSSAVDQQSYEMSYTRSWAPGTGAAPQGTPEMVKGFLGSVLPECQFDIIGGFYEDSLAANPVKSKLAVLHLDCDLYASTKVVLDHVVGRRALQDGAVIMCDDYNCNRARDDFGERRAMRETFTNSQVPYTFTEFFSYGWHGRSFFVHLADVDDVS